MQFRIDLAHTTAFSLALILLCGGCLPDGNSGNDPTEDAGNVEQDTQQGVDTGTAADTATQDTGSSTEDTGTTDDTGSQQDTSVSTDTGNGDNCTFSPDPSLAQGETAATDGVTAAHNKWRVRAGVPRVSWNETLAASAKAYAEECVWEHSDGSADAGFSRVGENLAMFGGSSPMTRAVDLWATERELWDFGMVVGDGNFSDYGHYTQVVWSATEEIGCGAASCSSIEGLGRGGTLIVCRYGPAGNFTGRAPYSESTGECLDLDNDDVLQKDDADDTDRSVQ